MGQLEGQYLGTFGPLRWSAGGGRVVADSRQRSRPAFGIKREETQGERRLSHGERGADPTLDLTARLGYADVDIERKDNQGESVEGAQRGMETLTPGVGVIWQPTTSCACARP